MTDRRRQGGRRRQPPRPARGPRRLAAALAALVVMFGGVALALRPDEEGPGRIQVVPIAVPLEPPPPPPPPPEPRQGQGRAPVTVTAVGDVMMGSSEHGLPPDDGAGTFSAVAGLLQGDVVIGNLEGPLTEGGFTKCPPPDAAATAPSSCFAFRTPPSYAAHLAEAGFDVMSVANNHAFDFGPQGLSDTLAALEEAGIEATGAVGATPVTDAGGTLVAVVGFAPYSWADPLLDLEAVAYRVAVAAAEADVVVVTMHAGAEGPDAGHVRPGPETYLGEERGDVMAFARSAIDAGADLVVGHGPHVLRGMEVYKDRLIAYSLGNFVGWEAFGLRGPLSTSAVLQARLAPDGRLLGGRLHPVQLVGEGRPAPGGDAIAVVDALSAEDFGPSAARLDPDGTIRPPEGHPAP